MLTRLALNRAFRVLALSSSLAEATQALGVDADRIEIVPNGVDTGRVRPGQAERDSIILFVGSLIERKGVRTLIEALPRVSQACPGYQVVVAGDGPQLGALQALTRTFGVESQVTFVGAQTPEQIQAWMGRASVFVLPSLEEGLGVVLLEALASGTPCVASRVGGIPDVVTPDTGELVPPGDPVALSDALVRVLADPVRRAELSRNARRRALELFDWQTIATRLSDIYRAAIEWANRNPQSPAGPHEPI
jgi:glycosyltransferase involved in cell wall biosynthesis